jgi:hypothetical protein
MDTTVPNACISCARCPVSGAAERVAFAGVDVFITVSSAGSLARDSNGSRSRTLALAAQPSKSRARMVCGFGDCQLGWRSATRLGTYWASVPRPEGTPKGVPKPEIISIPTPLQARPSEYPQGVPPAGHDSRHQRRGHKKPRLLEISPVVPRIVPTTPFARSGTRLASPI